MIVHDWSINEFWHFIDKPVKNVKKKCSKLFPAPNSHSLTKCCNFVDLLFQKSTKTFSYVEGAAQEGGKMETNNMYVHILLSK